MDAPKRRRSTLLEPAPVVARKLKDHPGRWFLIGTGERQHQRVMAQTAWRIRQNDAMRGLSDFLNDDTGYYEARSTADMQRPDQVAEVELYARWVPHDPAAAQEWLSADPGAADFLP